MQVSAVRPHIEFLPRPQWRCALCSAHVGVARVKEVVNVVGGVLEPTEPVADGAIAARLGVREHIPNGGELGLHGLQVGPEAPQQRELAPAPRPRSRTWPAYPSRCSMQEPPLPWMLPQSLVDGGFYGARLVAQVKKWCKSNAEAEFSKG